MSCMGCRVRRRNLTVITFIFNRQKWKAVRYWTSWMVLIVEFLLPNFQLLESINSSTSQGRARGTLTVEWSVLRSNFGVWNCKCSVQETKMECYSYLEFWAFIKKNNVIKLVRCVTPWRCNKDCDSLISVKSRQPKRKVVGASEPCSVFFLDY